ncbi:pre-60S factor rei1 [Tieghemiomyces parasiticus]|uniref:Pre-60S factor rei1 n=1 Tax=Tieghemiomyces parasiticus TaxID=78921 RepID=A0A9W8A898_9FUNG|nr:pre-60S factor rei1 [Tieghemiomyces parasiticus]
MAELPPVDAENFAMRVLSQQAKSNEEAANATSSFDCEACKKSYLSKNAYESHLESKKHREAESRKQTAEANRVENKTLNAKTDEKVVSDFPISDDEAEGHQTPSAVAASTGDVTMDTDQDNEEEESGVELTLKEQQARIREINRALDLAETQEEMDALIDKKIKMSPRLPLEQCLFCLHTSDTFEANMEHMTKAHSLFIPELEYLKDLRGLIKYLGEKISVANVCLYCNGRGRGLRTMEAVQHHMRDRGHCMIAYDDEIDMMELGDYYDFSSTYPDAEGPDGSNEGAMEVDGSEASTGQQQLITGRDARLSHTGEVVVSDDQSELTLPNGRRVGHRDYRRYYRQRLTDTDTRDAALINHLLVEYADGERPMSAAEKRKAEQALMRNQPKGQWALRQMRYGHETRRANDFRTRTGIKANKLQRHFRAQVLF